MGWEWAIRIDGSRWLSSASLSWPRFHCCISADRTTSSVWLTGRLPAMCMCPTSLITTTFRLRWIRVRPFRSWTTVWGSWITLRWTVAIIGLTFWMWYVVPYTRTMYMILRNPLAEWWLDCYHSKAILDLCNIIELIWTTYLFFFDLCFLPI